MSEQYHVLSSDTYSMKLHRPLKVNPSLAEHDMPCLSKLKKPSGSALFVIKYVNFYQKPGSSNLIGWKLEVGVATFFIQHEKG